MPPTIAMPPATSVAMPATPTDDAGCVADSMCRFVERVTGVGWLATGADWLLVTPITIVAIVVGAVVLRYVTHRAITRATRSTLDTPVPALLRPLRERAGDLDGLLSERRRQRAETIGSVLRSIASASILAVATMMVLGELGLDLAPLLASAGIAGVALGFGAQTLVRDFLAGMFMILEDQYGVGDRIDLGEASGTVESVGLRCTTLRDDRGVAWYVRNGEVKRVGNSSQGWAVVVLDVPVPVGTAVDRALAAMRDATERLAADPAYAPDLLGPAEVAGVEALDLTGLLVRVQVKVAVDAQWRVARELRALIGTALLASGVQPPAAGPDAEPATEPAGGVAGGVGGRPGGGPDGPVPGSDVPTGGRSDGAAPGNTPPG